MSNWTAEDDKLVTLAKSVRSRIGAASGAASDSCFWDRPTALNTPRVSSSLDESDHRPSAKDERNV